MASPLSLFRKHQKLVMAGMVLVAMAAFAILPSLEYLQPNSQAEASLNEVLVTWQGGKIRRSELDRMRSGHNLAALYLQAVLQETLKRDGVPRAGRIYGSMFAQIPDSAEVPKILVHTFLMARKAEKLGMVVTDAAVIEFLDQLSDGVIPRGEFATIFDQTLGGHVPQSYLMDQLRTELLAERMRATMGAGLVVPPTGAVTPGRAWEYFQRLNRNVQAELIPVRVSDYYDQLPPPPGDEQLKRELYEIGKDRFPDPDQPEPGFKRRRRARFQFARAEFSKFLEAEKEKIVGSITDEEIEKHYEDNKQQYIVAPTAPDDALRDESSGTSESGTSESGTSESDSSESDSSELPEESAEAPEAAQPAPSEVPDTAAEETADEAAEDTPDSGDQGARLKRLEHFVSTNAQDDAADDGDTSDGDTGDDDAAPPANAPPTSAESEVATSPASAEPTPPVTASEEEQVPPAATTEAEEKEVQYRPLDDELRAEIRQELADIQARKPAQDRQDAAFEVVERRVEDQERILRRQFRPSDSETEATAAPLELDVIDHDELLDLGETPLVDSISVAGYEIGQAYETQFVSWPPQTFRFNEIAFQEGLPLYTPGRISGAENGIEFLYWKAENQEPFVPEFEQAREEVVAAWKEQQALPFAQESADRLADEATASGKSLLELFGDREGLEVITTDLFSWNSTGLNPAAMGTPGISHVEGVEGVGPTFMASVFAPERDEVGTALNQPHDTVYVVRIVLESPSEDTLRQRFLISGVTSDVSTLADTDNLDLGRKWYEDLEAELGVDWKAAAN